MIKKSNNSKGITLIALVITIIVLLILAGVAISMLSGENGILNQAANAKEQTDKASTEEAVKLAALAGLTAGQGEITGDAAFNALNKGLDEAGYTGEDITKVPATVTIKGDDYVIKADGEIRKATEVEKNLGKDITGSKAILLDENNEQIVVPVGFKIKENSPTTVKRGIVVVAPDESEFVWVPVTDITKMATETDGVDSNNRKNYQGKLYDFKSENGVYSATEKENYGQGTTGYREPSLVTGVSGTDYDNGTDTSVTPNKKYYEYAGYSSAIDFEKAMQEDYNEMIESVKDNKGFYVGRYETSLNDSGYAQSISGIESAIEDDDATRYWYGLYKVEKDYSKNNSLTDKVESSMIWGSQYDQMMIWMQGNNIDVTDRTPTNLEGIKTSKNTTKVTGSKAEDKLNNIYDLLGNGYEWTLEARTIFARTSRGSSSTTGGSPSHRGGTHPSNANITSDYYSSRLALYIK